MAQANIWRISLGPLPFALSGPMHMRGGQSTGCAVVSGPLVNSVGRIQQLGLWKSRFVLQLLRCLSQWKSQARAGQVRTSQGHLARANAMALWASRCAQENVQVFLVHVGKVVQEPAAHAKWARAPPWQAFRRVSEGEGMGSVMLTKKPSCKAAHLRLLPVSRRNTSSLQIEEMAGRISCKTHGQKRGSGPPTEHPCKWRALTLL